MNVYNKSAKQDKTKETSLKVTYSSSNSTVFKSKQIHRKTNIQYMSSYYSISQKIQN